MSARAAGLVALYVASWAVVYWFARDGARRSEEVLGRLQGTPPDQATPILDELAELYRDSPRRAYVDFVDRPLLAVPIAAAAARSPECLSLVDEATRTVDTTGRVYLAITIGLGRAPGQGDGIWSPLGPPPPDHLRPLLFDWLDREPAPDVAVLLARTLRNSGWSITHEEVFARASRTDRPSGGRAAELAVLAREPGGPAALFDGLQRRAVPDDAAIRILNARILEADPGYRPFLLEFSTSRAHAAVSGGAYPVVAEALPENSHQIWAVVSAVEPDRRLPLMLSLLTRAAWPASHRAWWVGAWEEAAQAGRSDWETQLRDPARAILGMWIREEKNEEMKRRLRLAFDRLSRGGP